jgi:hypothetical protein
VITEAYSSKIKISSGRVEEGPKRLSILIGTHSMSALVSGTGNSRPELLISVSHLNSDDFEKNADALQFFATEHNLLSKQFERCTITVVSSDFTLIPQAFADKTGVEAVNFVNGRNHTRHLTHHLKALNVVAGFDVNWMNSVEKLFPNAVIKHCAAVTLSLFNDHPSLSGADVFLLINGADMELCARNEKGLLFYNVYKPQNDEDVLYYLLFAMEQFALNPLTLKLAFASNAETKQELLKTLQKYVRNLQLCSVAPGMLMEGEFKNISAHQYFQLLNQHLCE